MSQSEYDRVLSILPALTEAQFDAFSRICINDDSCLNPVTARALADLNLINYKVTGSLYSAEVSSIAAHMAWCEFCDKNFDDEGNRK